MKRLLLLLGFVAVITVTVIGLVRHNLVQPAILVSIGGLFIFTMMGCNIERVSVRIFSLLIGTALIGCGACLALHIHHSYWEELICIIAIIASVIWIILAGNDIDRFLRSLNKH